MRIMALSARIRRAIVIGVALKTTHDALLLPRLQANSRVAGALGEPSGVAVSKRVHEHSAGHVGSLPAFGAGTV